jgi:hypothetical protein
MIDATCVPWPCNESLAFAAREVDGRDHAVAKGAVRRVDACVDHGDADALAGEGLDVVGARPELIRTD